MLRATALSLMVCGARQQAAHKRTKTTGGYREGHVPARVMSAHQLRMATGSHRKQRQHSAASAGCNSSRWGLAEGKKRQGNTGQQPKKTRKRDGSAQGLFTSKTWAAAAPATDEAAVGTAGPSDSQDLRHACPARPVTAAGLRPQAAVSSTLHVSTQNPATESAHTLQLTQAASQARVECMFLSHDHD